MDKFMGERKKSFWDDSRFHDISFSFERTDKILKANKMILALVSPVFEEMFYGNFEKQDPVHIKDITYETFDDFLYFIYTENCVLSSLEDIEKLSYVANKYEVKTFEIICEHQIVKNIKDYNSEDVTKFAEMFGLKNLEWLSRLLQNNCPNTGVPASWVPYKKGDELEYPEGMVIAGYDEEGFPIGIGRFAVGGHMIPGTFDIKNGTVTVATCAKSYKNSENFEILCNGNLKWVESQRGERKNQSVEGNGSQYSVLYVGKVEHKGKLVVGKVQPSHGCLFIAWDDGEMQVHEKYFHLVDLNINESLAKAQPQSIAERRLLYDNMMTKIDRRLEMDVFNPEKRDASNAEKNIRQERLQLLFKEYGPKRRRH